MPFNHRVYIKEIAQATHTLQHWERLWLVSGGFREERGVWVRRYHFKPQELEMVYQISGMESVRQEAEKAIGIT